MKGTEETDSVMFLHDRVEDVGRLTAEQATSMLVAVPDSALQEDPEHVMTIVQEALNQQVRLHSVFQISLNSMSGTIGRRTTGMSTFSYDYAHLGNIYHTVANDEGVTSSKVTALLLDLLSKEEHMRDFPTHWLSASDPCACVVCQEKLLVGTAYTHVYKCLQTQAKATADKLWVDYRASLPGTCTWVTTVESKACKVNLTNATPEARQKHFHGHHSVHGYFCYRDGCKLTFSSRDELARHVYTHHGILLWTSSLGLFVWCHYCQRSIFEVKHTQGRLAHFASQYDQAIQAVRDYGYAGVCIGSSHAGHRPKQFIPLHCIFCLHNEKLDSEAQLMVCRKNEIATHMHSHFRYLASTDNIYCPASSAGGACHPLCRYEQMMNPVEAWKHIQEIHYGMEFGEQWGPGAPGRGKGKRAMNDGEEIRTKMYEKKKPAVIQSESRPSKRPAKSMPPIARPRGVPFKENNPNTHLTLQRITPPHAHKEYIGENGDLSLVDPMIR